MQENQVCQSTQPCHQYFYGKLTLDLIYSHRSTGLDRCKDCMRNISLMCSLSQYRLIRDIVTQLADQAADKARKWTRA